MMTVCEIASKLFKKLKLIAISEIHTLQKFTMKYINKIQVHPQKYIKHIIEPILRNSL